MGCPVTGHRNLNFWKCADTHDTHTGCATGLNMRLDTGIPGGAYAMTATAMKTWTKTPDTVKLTLTSLDKFHQIGRHSLRPSLSNPPPPSGGWAGLDELCRTACYLAPCRRTICNCTVLITQLSPVCISAADPVSVQSCTDNRTAARTDLPHARSHGLCNRRSRSINISYDCR